MRRAKSTRIAIGLGLLAVAAFTTGCGANNNGAALAPAASGLYGSGTCVPLTPSYYGQTGTNQIGFQGTSIYFDSANIIGGAIPIDVSGTLAGYQIGQVLTGVGSGPVTTGGAYTYGIQTNDGSITTVQVTPVQTTTNLPYSGYPNGAYNTQFSGSYGSQVANLIGNISLSSEITQDILNIFGNGGYGGYTYPGTYNGGVMPTNPYTTCISGVAINVGYFENQLYGGVAYLYINGTAHGYILEL